MHGGCVPRGKGCTTTFEVTVYERVCVCVGVHPCTCLYTCVPTLYSVYVPEWMCVNL